jgi:hypothetical protein
MGARGPAPSCGCGRCPKCRARAAARQRYHGITLPPLAAGRFRASRLHLPTDAATVAYVAGLFDGEGSVVRYENGRGTWIAQIGMTDLPLMKWLAGFGGTLTVEPAGRGRDGHHRLALHRWRITAQAEVAEFLSAVMPYLRVKRERSIQAIGEIAARGRARHELLALEVRQEALLP